MVRNEIDLDSLSRELIAALKLARAEFLRRFSLFHSLLLI